MALTQQWLLVSDVHVNPFDRSAEPAAYQEDTNWTLFGSAVAEMRKAAPNADVVVLEGDFLAHEFAAKVRASGSNRDVQTEALATMSRIAASFGGAFPRAQFIIALGNNDDPCGDYRTAPGTTYLAKLARIWAPLVNRNRAAPAFVRSFAQNGSYVARLPNGLRAVVLDDVPWSLFFRGCGRGAGEMRANQLAMLTSQLKAAPADRRDVVFLHIPPGIDVASTLLAQRFLVVPYLRADVTATLETILRVNRDRVAFVIAGHTHRSDFRIDGGVPILIAPAVSPVYSNNPSFLIVQVDDSTIRDYQMYSEDLFDQSWSHVFDFRQGYGVAELTAKNLQTVHTRLPGDFDLRVRWEGSVTGFSRAYTVRPLWRAFWCAQTELGAGYAACAGDQRRVALLPVALVCIGLALVSGVAFVRMRLARRRRVR